VLVSQFGYYDMWEVFSVARQAKFFMSICVCIQLLKIIKFTNVIIPKMSLMTRVLAKGCYDLLFFGIIFVMPHRHPNAIQPPCVLASAAPADRPL